MLQPSHVVVGYDFSHSGRAALQRAAALAARGPGHVLHVVCAIDPRDGIPSIPRYAGPVADDTTYAARVQEALAVETRQELDALDIPHVVHFFVHARLDARPARAILALAAEVGADLIVVGSHGLTGVERWLVGSTSESIVREARCTVEVARPTRYAVAAAVATEPGEDPAPAQPEPHRYEYEDHRASLRPPEWPIS